MLTPLALGMPGAFEWIIIGGIGLLLFGKRLPEVGRSIGKGIVEFKKGLREVENDIDTPSTSRPVAPAHKFDPYTGKPLDPSV